MNSIFLYRHKKKVGRQRALLTLNCQSLEQGSHSPGKPGIWPKQINKFLVWKNHGIWKKDIFMEKSWNFVLVIHIFFNIRIHFAEFILCHLCFFLNLIFDYWWLHGPKSFDVKTIWANNNNLGKLHMQPKRNWATWKNNRVSWKNYGIYFSVLSGNPAWSCVSLPRFTISCGWKLVGFVKFNSPPNVSIRNLRLTQQTRHFWSNADLMLAHGHLKLCLAIAIHNFKWLKITWMSAVGLKVTHVFTFCDNINPLIPFGRLSGISRESTQVSRTYFGSCFLGSHIQA